IVCRTFEDASGPSATSSAAALVIPLSSRRLAWLGLTNRRLGASVADVAADATIATAPHSSRPAATGRPEPGPYSRARLPAGAPATAADHDRSTVTAPRPPAAAEFR